MFTVYLHLNRINGKGYVGWTAKTMQDRWQRHVSGAVPTERCLMARAIRKHGSGDDVWLHRELFSCEDEQMAKNAEVFWIAELNTNACRGGHGYNMTDGGEGRTGFVADANSRAKMSAASKGRPKSAQHRESIRACMLEKWQDPAFQAIFIGRKRNEKSRQKMAAARVGRTLSEEHRKNIAAAGRRRWAQRKSQQGTSS